MKDKIKKIQEKVRKFLKELDDELEKLKKDGGGETKTVPNDPPPKPPGGGG